MRFLMILTLYFVAYRAAADDFAQNWHQWRGPEANGVSRTAAPPLTWSENENVRWKVPIEGQGSSTPIVWRDQVFVLTVLDTKRADPERGVPDEPASANPFGITNPNTFHQYVVICLDRRTGTQIWRRVAAEQVPAEGHHPDNDFASASPTTDGQKLYVWFGSAGMYCYSLQGDLLWSRNLGSARTRLSFGEGSSPVIYDDKLIITRDQEDQSYITVLNAQNGETIWQQNRDEPSCWATPIVVEHEGSTQLITNAHNRVRSYDLHGGELIWECGGQVSNVTPSPVNQDDFVICMSGYRGSAVMALPLTARGDISESGEIRWSKTRDTPYVPSPLLYDGLLYFNRSNEAILTCLDARTGEAVIERTRLPDLRRIYASPVGAQNRVYFVGRDGTTLVLQRGSELRELATNRLDEPIDASPALAGNDLFLRSEKSLYCISR